MKRSSILIGIILFVSAVIAFPQTFFSGNRLPRFTLIDRSDGISNLSVSSIVQDDQGFIWMGTQGGLNRYDGRKFQIFRHDPYDSNSLPHDLIQTMYYDRKGNAIWIGTYNGLSRFDLTTYEFRNYSAGDTQNALSNSVVVAIERDDDGHVWVGTLNGLNRLNPETGDVTLIDTVDPVIRSLHVDHSGQLWIGGYGGLERWDPQSQTVKPAAIDLTSPYVMSITSTESGSLLLGVWGAGIVRFDPSSGTSEEYTLGDDRVYAVIEVSGGSLWAGTWGGGLFAITPDGSLLEFTAEDPQGLASNVVYSLMEDRAGLVWIGTNGGGIHKLSPRRSNYRQWYADPDDAGSIPAGKVNSLYRDVHGVLWAGIYNGGLNRLGEPGDPVVSYRADPEDPASLVNDIVNHISEDPQGNLWVASHGGLQRFDREHGAFELWGRDIHPEAPLSDEIIYELQVDSQGRYWIGTYNSGVDRYTPETGELINFRHDPDDPATLSDNLVYDILEDHQGTIWVATNAGLNRFTSDAEGFVRYLHDPGVPGSLPANTVRQLFEDSQNQLWITMVSGGVARFDRDSDTFIHFSQADGLPSNGVISIEEGIRGRLWLGTQNGIAILDPASGEIGVLDQDAGLFGVEFNEGSWRDPDGTVYFGGTHGITVLSSDRRSRNESPPLVHISDVQVYQDSLNLHPSSYNGSTVSIDFHDRFLGFEFVALDYESPERNQYAHRLVGFDEEWVYSGTRNYATYTNLPPGRYELQVRASNNHGVWSSEPARMTVHVNPPWYRTWWAFTIYGLLLMIVIWGGWRVREGQVLARQYDELSHTNALLEKANAELERLSLRDNLTSLFNRRYFDSRFNEEWQRARRSKRPLSLIMADVDYFKAYNDNYGHVAGDRCLSSLAGVFGEQIVRSTDFVARYGGEEFAVVLFETDQAGAQLVAERLRQAVQELSLERSDNPAGADSQPVVTISFGVYSAIPQDHQTPDEFVAMADRALYRAKAAGRNAVRT